MKNIATYSARRTNPFVWLAAFMMAASAAAKIVFFARAGAEGVLAVVVRLILPVAANLLIAIRLPLRGEKFFYVTVRPVVLLAICYIVEIFSLELPIAMTIACLIFCILQTVLYYRTFTGSMNSTMPVLFSYIAVVLIMLADRTFRTLFGYYPEIYRANMYSNLLALLGIIFVILSAKKLPDPEPGEAYRPRYGDRMDGRRIRSLPPMAQLSPYFMVHRNESTNSISDSIEVSNIEKYIHQKRREGCKHFGITHVFLASYVRACAEYPGLNRFLAGQKVYQRYTIDVSMVIKKDMKNNAPDTTIKVHFAPTDTATQVYEKFDAAVQAVKATQELDNGFDHIAQLISYIPGVLCSATVALLKGLDYFGLLPPEIMELSPFHGSMFITSMGSLGIPPIIHHLYDFGNVAQFVAFGAKRSERTLDAEGNVIIKKYVDYVYNTDERTVDGFYYATVLKRVRSLMAHPEQLDEVHEAVEDIY